MNENTLSRALPADFNRRVFLIYIAAFLTVLVLGLGYMLYKGKFIYLGLILASPVLILFLTQPKLAVGQYILALFISRLIFEGQPWLLADLSGFILIAAASLDLVSDSKLHTGLPRLSLNFLFLLLAIFTAGLFSYQPVAALGPFGRITLLFLYFLAMHRLSGKVSLAWSLNLFFWLSLIHSIAVLIPFLASSGTFRSYGLAPVEMATLALVIATAKYLWAKRGAAWIYLMGMVLIFFALLAAQYRSLIIIGAVMSALVVLFSLRRAKLELGKDSNETGPAGIEELIRIRKRPRYLLAGLLFSVALVIMLYPQLLAPLLDRFERLLTASPSGSLLLRMTLWKLAWSQFIENPLTGIGPGLFNQIQNVVPVVRMDFFHFHVRGLSAHNLLLHYLAEAGIIGGIAALAMMINQVRLSYKAWLGSASRPVLEVSAILLGISATILFTTLTESSWLWGQSSIVFAFFLSLIARNHNNLVISENTEFSG